MDKKYTVLRTLGKIYKVLGIIGGVLTILSVLGICATSVFGGVLGGGASNDPTGIVGILAGGVLGGLIVGTITLIYGGAAAVTLYAFGEGIELVISLEENTRKAALALEQRR